MTLPVGATGAHPEQVLVAAQRRVVVVGAGGVRRAGVTYLALSRSAPIWPPPGAWLSVPSPASPGALVLGPGQLVAAGRVGPGPAHVGLVEGDDDQHVPAPVRRGAQDEGHPDPEEPVGPAQAPGISPRAVGPGAGVVVTVVAQVRCDEPEARRRLLAPEVLGQMAVRRRRAIRTQGAERDHVGVAFCGVVDDGVEPDERVVAGRVLVLGGGHLGRVGRTDGGVGAVGTARRVRGAAVREGVLPMSCS